MASKLDTFNSRAIAVCDHQVAHVYVPAEGDRAEVRELIAALPGVGRVFAGDERAELHLVHPRSGELVLLADLDSWFAYPFWLDDKFAPDYARTVAIHNKPGYDPCELFIDPNLTFPYGRMAFRLVQKKLGFRMKLDVVPLDANLVRGSHGLPSPFSEDRPLLIGDGPAPPEDLPMTAVRDLVLNCLR